MPPYRVDADWKSLDPTLASRSLSIRNEIQVRIRIVSTAWEVDPDLAEETHEEQIAVCGYRCLLLAQDLRRHYDLPVFEPEHSGWEFDHMLKPRYDRVMKKTAERKAVAEARRAAS